MRRLPSATPTSRLCSDGPDAIGRPCSAQVPELLRYDKSSVCVNQGVVFRPRALYSCRCAALELVGGGVANGYFLVHALRPPIETSIEAADQRALNRRTCSVIVETT